jgi:hypothetical protein
MVDKDTGGQDVRPGELFEEVAQVVHELAEALTALGNYLAATAYISDGGKANHGQIREALEKGLSQHERASVALHRLQVLLTNRKHT